MAAFYVRRHHAANDIVRSGVDTDHQEPALLVAQGLGDEDRKAPGHASRHCRRLAVVFHRMRTNGTAFRWGSEPGTVVVV